LTLIPVANSENWNYGVDIGVGETNNVALLPTNPVSQTLAIADLDFALKEQSLRLEADLKGDFSYVDYLQHAYGGQLLGRFDGIGYLALLPELRWVLQDDFGQAQVNPFLPNTPANLENVEYVSTGPDLSLRLASTGFLNVSARFARTDFQTSPFNSNRVFASLSWGDNLSAGSSLALDGNVEDVLYENTTLNTDFKRYSLFGHYELHGATNDLVLKAGATSVSESGASNSGPLLKLLLKHKLSAASNLALTAGRELTDAATSFSLLQSGAIGGITTAPAPLTAQTYTATYSAVTWDFQRNRTSLAVSGRWEQDHYPGEPADDNSRSGGEFNVDRKLSRALSAQLLGSLYYTDYSASRFTARDTLLGAALTLREGRGLEFKLRYNHQARAGGGIGQSYTENVGFLTIGYRPGHGSLQ
jgi:hypothetical protein